MADEAVELIVADAAGWRDWLEAHVDEHAAVWLVLAKKGTTTPTSLTYAEALDEALAHGWIDGQVGRRDEVTYRQRFTPRRRRSNWSARNAERVERLLREGRMHPAGIAEMERARADGRWPGRQGSVSTSASSGWRSFTGGSLALGPRWMSPTTRSFGSRPSTRRASGSPSAAGVRQ